MSLISKTATAIATAILATYVCRKPAYAQNVSVMATAHRDLIQAMLGNGPSTTTQKTLIGGLTPSELEWVEWNLNLARQ